MHINICPDDSSLIVVGKSPKVSVEPCVLYRMLIWAYGIEMQILLIALIPKCHCVTLIHAVVVPKPYSVLFQQADQSRLLRKISRLLFVFIFNQHVA